MQVRDDGALAEPVTVLPQPNMKGLWYLKFGKRWFDLALIILLFVPLVSLIGLIAILVHFDSPGPILFVQERLGVGGAIFRAYKFRTMTNRPRKSDREIFGRDQEVTRVGYWLRRFKLDELPQIVNVIKGEMSIVGPRPALPIQLSEYDKVGRKRLDVRPGLTGLAQVNGNIHLSWPQRWRYDAVYLERLSLRLDLWIIWRTVSVLIFGEDRFIKQPHIRQENGD